jgi:hypothetical protein
VPGSIPTESQISALNCFTIVAAVIVVVVVEAVVAK